MNSEIIPKEIYNYVLEKNRKDLMINIEDCIPKQNEYSLIVKLFYFISLISKNEYKDLKRIKNHFNSSNISLTGIDEILYLLTSEYKIFSIKTFEFVTSKSILQWISEYGEINIIIDLYDYIFNKYKINYKEILKFVKSLENNDELSKKKLVEEFRTLICNISKRTFIDGSNTHNIQQECYQSLFKCVSMYNLERHRFVAYATNAIKNNINDLIKRIKTRRSTDGTHALSLHGNIEKDVLSE